MNIAFFCTFMAKMSICKSRLQTVQTVQTVQTAQTSQTSQTKAYGFQRAVLLISIVNLFAFSTGWAAVAPVVSGVETTALSYTENATALALTATAAVTDVDNTTLTSAAVRITVNFQSGADVLSYTQVGAIVGTWTAATGTLSLSGADTTANYRSALRAVRYQNTSDNPTTLARTISFVVNDGTLNSSAVTRSLSVVAVNDAPLISAMEAATLSYPEASAATPVSTTMVVSDMDTASLVSASVKISANYQSGSDVLTYTQVGAIVGTWTAYNGTLSLTGADTVAHYQDALRAVRFQNLNRNPSVLSRTLSLQVNDGSLASVIVTRALVVAAINDPPLLSAIEATVLNYTEDAPAVPASTAVVVADVDSLTLASVTVAITVNYQAAEDLLAFVNTPKITGAWNAATGVMTLSGVDTPANYQAALRTVTYRSLSQNPSTLVRTIAFAANDGVAAALVVTRQVQPVRVNDAPTLTVIEPTTLSYTEATAAIPLTATMVVADFDSPTLTSATVRLSPGFIAAEDLLAIPVTAGLSSAWDAVTGTLTLTGVLSPGAYQTALRSVTYRNTSRNPNIGLRTVTWTISDGAMTSLAMTRQVEVIPVNDAPVLSAFEATPLAALEQVPTALSATLVASDIDSPLLASAKVTISGNYQGDEDVLSLAPWGAVSGTWDAATGVLSLSGIDTVANYQSALRLVKYLDTSDNPSALVRTLTVVVNDGLLDSPAVTRTLSVTPVNDAPVLSDVEPATRLYQEGTPAVQVSAAIDVGDVDSPVITSATVKISGGYRTAEDILAFPGISGVTGAWDAVTGILTLTGSASSAQYQQVLRAVTYRNTSAAPVLAVRALAFQVSDGNLLSNTVTRTVTPVAVNQAPILSAIEAAPLIAVEKAAPVALTAALVLTDVDSATCAGGVVRIATNYQTGQDVLSYATVGLITGTWDSANATLTLSGADTRANYLAAMKAVKYQYLGATASPAVRTVTWQVTDGVGTSNVVSRQLSITPVNDAPTITALEATAQTFSEGGPAVPLTATAVVADPDNALLASATVRISANFRATEDLLAFTDTATISGAWNAVTGVLTLTGNDSSANYQAALATVTYRNVSANPTVLARTVSFQVSDGVAVSAAAVRTVNIVSVNSAPLLAGMETASFVIAVGPAKALTAALTVADPDSLSLASATVSIATNYQTG